MAIASSSSSIPHFTLLALSFFSLLSLKTTNGDTHIQRHNFHNIELSYLFPSDSCIAPSSNKGLKNEASLLQVVHKNGPCAHAVQQLSLDEILGQDQSRVNSIRSRSRTDGSFTDSSTTIPAMDGSTVGSGDYIVTVGLGTPVKKLSLVFDTGSGLSWTQCKPCGKSCYHQKEMIFEPSRSTSYNNVSCEAAVCSALVSAGNTRDCSSSTCVYGVKYGDSSFSKGFFAKEKLSLTSTDGVDEFYFGCGHNNHGNFSGAAGILGLGRDTLSLNYQASDKYNNIFSYCLPSTSSSSGFLSLGATKSKSPTVYTPISKVPKLANFYSIDITAISVGGRKLPISASVFSTAKAIIDSGTAITRLPPAAYSALRSAFRKQMSKYPIAPPLLFLDTCYDLTKYKSVNVPKIEFIFRGGVNVNIDFSGILYAKNISQVCLAFAGNENANDVAIFGNIQQKTMAVVYDGAKGRIGFASGGCS
ncbi:Aspartyl protease family protein At5g10770 [Linum perenne]